MQTRSPTESETDWRATVAVRVPRDADGSLADDASRRLATRGPVRDVDVVALQALEPALAATVVRLEVSFRTTGSLDVASVEEQVTDAPGVQRVEDLRPA